jgi:hypothetical protein
MNLQFKKVRNNLIKSISWLADMIPLYVYIHTYMYIHIHKCIYIYIYIYIHKYEHTDVYIDDIVPVLAAACEACRMCMDVVGSP